MNHTKYFHNILIILILGSITSSSNSKETQPTQQMGQSTNLLAQIQMTFHPNSNEKFLGTSYEHPISQSNNNPGLSQRFLSEDIGFANSDPFWIIIGIGIIITIQSILTAMTGLKDFCVYTNLVSKSRAKSSCKKVIVAYTIANPVLKMLFIRFENNSKIFNPFLLGTRVLLLLLLAVMYQFEIGKEPLGDGNIEIFLLAYVIVIPAYGVLECIGSRRIKTLSFNIIFGISIFVVAALSVTGVVIMVDKSNIAGNKSQWNKNFSQLIFQDFVITPFLMLFVQHILIKIFKTKRGTLDGFRRLIINGQLFRVYNATKSAAVVPERLETEKSVSQSSIAVRKFDKMMRDPSETKDNSPRKMPQVESIDSEVPKSSRTERPIQKYEDGRYTNSARESPRKDMQFCYEKRIQVKQNLQHRIPGAPLNHSHRRSDALVDGEMSFSPIKVDQNATDANMQTINPLITDDASQGNLTTKGGTQTLETENEDGVRYNYNQPLVSPVTNPLLNGGGKKDNMKFLKYLDMAKKNQEKDALKANSGGSSD